METQKTPNSQSNLEEKNKAGGIISLASDYTTKLQSSEESGSGTKTEIYVNATS